MIKKYLNSAYSARLCGEYGFAHGASKLKIALYHNKDFWAGIMLIATGAASIFIARDYPFGSTMRMGPGYFPTMLGGILVLFGLYVLIMRTAQRRKDYGSLLASGVDRAIPLTGRIWVFNDTCRLHTGAGGAHLWVSVRGAGVQVRRDPAAYRYPDRALGRHIHLGPRVAVPIDQRILTPSPWNFSTI